MHFIKGTSPTRPAESDSFKTKPYRIYKSTYDMHHYTKNNENVFFVAVLTSTFFNKII